MLMTGTNTRVRKQADGRPSPCRPNVQHIKARHYLPYAIDKDGDGYMNIEVGGIPTLDFEKIIPPSLLWLNRIFPLSRFDELVKLPRLVPKDKMYRVFLDEERA
jgi:hypothetical protein